MVFSRTGILKINAFLSDKKKHKDIENKVKLCELYFRTKFKELQNMISNYSEVELRSLKYYIKGEVIRTQHAVQWQNANMTTLGVILGSSASVAILSDISPLEDNLLYIFAMVALILYFMGRRLILQNHAGAYQYILAVMEDIPLTRKNKKNTSKVTKKISSK